MWVKGEAEYPVYITSGDLPATNIGGGDLRAHWIIHREDLETFAQRIETDAGRLPVPKGGWPHRSPRPKAIEDDRQKKLTA